MPAKVRSQGAPTNLRVGELDRKDGGIYGLYRSSGNLDYGTFVGLNNSQRLLNRAGSTIGVLIPSIQDIDNDEDGLPTGIGNGDGGSVAYRGFVWVKATTSNPPTVGVSNNINANGELTAATGGSVKAFTGITLQVEGAQALVRLTGVAFTSAA